MDNDINNDINNNINNDINNNINDNINDSNINNGTQENKNDQIDNKPILYEVSDTKLFVAYIKKNQDKILKNKFSIPAFLFNGLYLIYRKMYLIGFLIIFAYEFALICLPIYIGLPIGILIMVLTGIFTNKKYLDKCYNDVMNIKRRNNKPEEELVKICESQGGTNLFLSIFIIILVSGFVSVLHFYVIPNLVKTVEKITPVVEENIKVVETNIKGVEENIKNTINNKLGKNKSNVEEEKVNNNVSTTEQTISTKQTFTTKQIVNQLKKSKAFKALMQEGLSVKASEDKIIFSDENYKLEANLDGSILTISGTVSFDSCIDGILYDTIGMLYNYDEGETYSTLEKVDDYNLNNQGVELDGKTFKIDVSKQPIILQNKYDLDELISEFKAEYISLKNPDYVSEEAKKAQAVETMQLFVATIKTNYYDELYIKGEQVTFEQLIKQSSDEATPTNCTGSITNSNLILSGCKVDTYTCSYNSTDNVICK